MVIVELETGNEVVVEVSPVESNDLKRISKERYSFDWKKESAIGTLYKLTMEARSDILGLVSIINFSRECRLEIHLLCSSRENTGKNKKYDGIVGCLMTFVGAMAFEKYLENACISLLPKTELRLHYKRKYGMQDGGPQLFLEGARLQALVNKYLL